MYRYILLSLVLVVFACKEADFSSRSNGVRKQTDLNMGKAGKGGGKLDASDGDGEDSGGKDSGPDGGSDSNSDSDGNDSGGKDSGGDSDSSDSGDSDGGNDSDDGEDDLFIGDDGVDEDDDGDDLDSDEDEITGKKAILTIKGLRRDSNDSPQLVIKRGNKTKRVAWPKKGETIEVEDICSTKDVEIEIETELRGETFKPSQSQCFIAKENGDNSWHVGFEHDCNSNDYNKIDDAIATFTCSISSFSIEDIQIKNSIPMGEWVD